MSAWNQGGILDSVELRPVPAVRVEDVFVRPDWENGVLRLQANVRNATTHAQRGQLECSVAPASAGGLLAVSRSQREFASGDTLVESELTVPQHRLWELNDPFLYRVTARVWVDGSPSSDEHSVRCGFRDFRLAAHGRALRRIRARHGRAQPRRVETEVVLWGEDATLVKWLSDRRIATRPFQRVDPKSREVIFVGLRPPAPGGTEAFRSLTAQLARGSTAVFLCPEAFAQDGKGVRWVPLSHKGTVANLNAWL